MDIVTSLVQLLIEDWHPWAENKTYFLDTLVPLLKTGQKSSEVTDKELEVMKRLRAVCSEEEWDRLPEIVARVSENRGSIEIRLPGIDNQLAREIDNAIREENTKHADILIDKSCGFLPISAFAPLTRQFLYKKADERLNDIERILMTGDIEKANVVFQNCKGIVSQSQFTELTENCREKTIREGLSEIECLLNEYDFRGADNLFAKYRQVIPRENYSGLRNTYQERQKANLLQGMLHLLNASKFDEATKIFNSNKGIITDNEYISLKTAALRTQFKNEISDLLRGKRYHLADQAMKKSGLLSDDDYHEMKATFFREDIKRTFTISVDDNQALTIARKLIGIDPGLANEFSFEKLHSIVIQNLETIRFPFHVYEQIVSNLAEDISKETVHIGNDTIYTIVLKYLICPESAGSQNRSLWKLFVVHPNVLQQLVSCRKDLIDGIAATYPYDKLNEIAAIYIPPERFCLEYLKGNEIRLHFESFGKLKSIFQENRYFNCEMVLALRRVKRDGIKIRVDDIVGSLLREIVNRAFDYEAEAKRNIENLVFPECLSDFRSKHFHISARRFVFCEGRLIPDNGKAYILCRNRRCNERTKPLEEKGRTTSDNYFFNLLEKEFDIPSDGIWSNENFVRAMGSFNRWNEIAERLVCGFGGTGGCGSTLIYSSSPPGDSGWAAYATTYWRCSNESCSRHAQTVKLSHCGGGCGKIIDSRIDAISCERSDEREFFVCLGCGYCCMQHEVSGICPKCGTKDDWEKIDEYAKKYRCKSCAHEIVVPGRLKGCLGSDVNGIEKRGFDKRPEKTDKTSCHDKNSVDDDILF